MDLKDDNDYAKESREDLVARLMAAQALDQFLFKAYDALKHYGVDFKALPEWQKALVLWDEAAKLRPAQAANKIVNSIVTLGNAVKAAVRRKQMALV